MLNRIDQPSLGTVNRLTVAEPEIHYLSNNIPVYIIEAGDQDIIKLDILFDAGSRYQKKIFQASFANSMLIEGTKTKTAHQIAEELDFYGSYLYPGNDRDQASVQAYCLGKFLPATLSIAADIIKNPSFEQKELDTLRNKRRQSLAIDNQKVEYRAKKIFFKSLFGPNHPYGQIGEEENLAGIHKSDLQIFHQSYYQPNNCRIIISGKQAGKHLPLLEDNFGNWERNGKETGELFPVGKENISSKLILREDIPGAVQASIRIGGIMPTRKHQDFSALNIANTLLGGYFGSRLMQNIREDKGYTYGISSSLFSFQKKGVFLIGTDVGIDYYKPTLKEIYFELERLSTQVVLDSELKRVRLYIEGELLRQLDGPYNQADSFKVLLSHGLDFNFLKIYLDVLNQITPEGIREISERYFNPDSFVEVVAGVKPD